MQCSINLHTCVSVGANTATEPVDGCIRLMRQAAHTVLNFALAALFVAGGESFLASLTVLARHRPLFGVVGVASTSGKEVLDDFQEDLGEKPPVRTSSLLLVLALPELNEEMRLLACRRACPKDSTP